MLNRIYVKGEISNCKYHPSGHIYFSLKDESGTIAWWHSFHHISFCNPRCNSINTNTFRS